MTDNVIEMYRAPAALPPEIKKLKAWVVWKLEQRFGEAKPRKVPYYIDGRRRQGEQGVAEDVAALTTFDRACLACERGGYTGIGLALLPQWGVVAVDFDDVVVDGRIHPEVAALVECTYSELSPSGKGVRAFFMGSVPANRKDNTGSPQVEFFTSKGFVTVTGNVTDVCSLLGLEEVAAPITPEVVALYRDRFGEARVSSVAVEDMDDRQAREMLDKIDPDAPHDVWFRVALGLHHQFGNDGFILWNEWSARGTKYPGVRSLLGRWKSIRADDSNPVTISSVRQLAVAGGWVEDVTDKFEVLPPIAANEPVLPGFKRDKNGRIEAAIENVVLGSAYAPFAGFEVAFDQFRDEIMLSRDGGENWESFRDTHYVELRIALERRGFKPIGREIIRDAIAKVAEDRQFDSAQLWLDSLKWDGVPRIERFLCDYWGASHSAYHRAVSTYFWTALAGRVLQPGIKADMVPILVGRQGIRKSSGVAAMVPHVDLFAEISFHEKEQDLSRKMRGRLVAEIGELRGLHSREVEHIKAFITRTHEDWTPKYREFNTRFARRLVFAGTTNKDEFLADETGNRRFLPVNVSRVDVERIEKDRDQMWAEARIRFMAEGVLWQDAEKQGAEVHHQYMMRDSWEDAIEKWLGSTDVENDGFVKDRAFISTTDALTDALLIDNKLHTRQAEMRVGNCLRALGYVRKKMRVLGRPRWVFVPSVPIDDALDGNVETPF